MSARGITVSTVGLVPRMQQLATEGIPVTLALSLHAPDDELRDELVPINTRWNIDEVVNAAWEYARQTKRRVSIEYILIRDVNDQAFRADLLAKVLKRRGNWGWVHVNLIPLNPTPGSRWTASRRRDEDEFVRQVLAGQPERRAVVVQPCDPAEQHGVHHDRIPVPRHPQGNLLVDLQDGRVGMRRDEVVEDRGDLAEQLARALQRRDGVGEVGRGRVVGDRSDLGGVVREGLLEGRQEVLRLDLIEGRGRKWRHPGLQQRVGLGVRSLAGF
jgi:hypothetical protein